ncbi:hypothetical protein Scep_020279 [Stephania cephalantha]|uniref:Uncharacterized protein n=1 Tax=Stephania cephalantha TaxID=152367 RepID=A0AAP0ICJ6_9MAGN
MQYCGDLFVMKNYVMIIKPVIHLFYPISHSMLLVSFVVVVILIKISDLQSLL